MRSIGVTRRWWRQIFPLLIIGILIFVASCATVPPEIEEPEEAVEPVEPPQIDGSIIKEPEKDPDLEEREEKIEEKREEVLSIPREALLLEDLSEEKRERLSKFIDEMMYLVYSGDPDFDTPSFRIGLEAANSYLLRNGYGYVEYGQVRRMMEQRAERYEEETGGQIPPLRWSAESFDADIYVDLRIKTNTGREGMNHLATSAVSLMFFYTNTGEMWGKSSTVSSSVSVSSESREKALERSLKKTVGRAMSEGIEATRRKGIQFLREGLSYTLILRSTYDKELLRNFVKNFEKKVESLERSEASLEQMKFTVKYIGDVTELEDAVLETAKTTRGLEEMFLVYQRGNTITFNTGI